MRRRELLMLSLASFVTGTCGLGSHARAAEPMTLYKDPNCGCCAGHADYLTAHGFTVTIVETADLDAVRRQHRVPEALAGCHTILAGGYVIEGHVPIGPIRRLLTERPEIIGISLIGMPSGSPGMEGEKAGPFTIYQIDATSGTGEPRVFAVD
jgi:hypothetical protein